jgi:hypothetical protein
MRNSDLNEDGKKHSKTLKNHIFALKQHIKGTNEFLRDELETISPRVDKLKQTLAV